MPTKLTLRLDESLIDFGKRWAQARGKSLSRVVADYLATLEKLSEQEGELPPITRSLLGVARGVEEQDYWRYIEAKHR